MIHLHMSTSHLAFMSNATYSNIINSSTSGRRKEKEKEKLYILTHGTM